MRERAVVDTQAAPSSMTTVGVADVRGAEGSMRRIYMTRRAQKFEPMRGEGIGRQEGLSRRGCAYVLSDEKRDEAL
jgi:hypothetical protein